MHQAWLITARPLSYLEWNYLCNLSNLIDFPFQKRIRKIKTFEAKLKKITGIVILPKALTMVKADSVLKQISFLYS